MNEITVYNQTGEEVGKVSLPVSVFGLKLNQTLVQQVLQAQLANARQNLAHTKDRGTVRGGGRKPWRQKGTGRARHGSTRSPIWKGGGVAFGPTKERNFAKDINKKMKRKALFMALSSKANDGQLLVVDKLSIDQPKTRVAAKIMSDLTAHLGGYRSGKVKKDSILTVIPADNKTIDKSFGNLPFAGVIDAKSLNIYDVLKHKYLLLTQDSIDIISKHFKL